MSWGPTSIETVDSKVLNLAMEDIVWDSVSDYFPSHEGEPEIRGINLVEYTGDDEEELKRKGEEEDLRRAKEDEELKRKAEELKSKEEEEKEHEEVPERNLIL